MQTSVDINKVIFEFNLMAPISVVRQTSYGKKKKTKFNIPKPPRDLSKINNQIFV